MRLRQLGFGAALAAAMGGAPAGAAAQDIAFPSDNPLARWILPYSPIIFDFAIQAGRSFAEITYDRRGYDAVTGSFTVSGLRIARDQLDLAVDRARIGPEMTLLEGVTLNTRALDLPPEARQALQRLGRDTVTGDILARFRFNEARSAIDFSMVLDFPDAGLIEVAALVDGFHVLVPLSDLETAQIPQEPTVTGTLHRATLSYRDDGLIDVIAAIAAEDAGITGDQLLDGIAVMPVMTVPELLAGLPGGASEAFRERALEWARTVEGFLRERGAIRVSFDPAEPVPLARFQSGLVDEALLQALNPSFSGPSFSGTAEAGAKQVEAGAGPVGAALALIGGQGVPQNREAGARELLRLADEGDQAAIQAVATAFGQGPLPDLGADDQAGLYAVLLAARAVGAAVSDATLSTLAAGLAPEAAMRAETDAAALFSRLPEGEAPALDAARLATLDARGLRALAYDLLEGRGIPRSFTEAYAVASVAAAAGDPFAASLRDDLADAARDRSVALSLEKGRARADEIWRAYSAGRGATP